MMMKKKKALLIVLLLSLMIFVFAMSAKPIDESVALSSAVDRWICSFLVPGYKQMEPMQQKAFAEGLDFGVRKAAHFLEYLALGGVLCLTIGLFTLRERVKWTAAVLIGTVFAALDEFHQSFVPGRDGALRDVIIDTIGIMAGIVLIGSINKVYHKRRNVWQTSQMKKNKKNQ